MLEFPDGFGLSVLFFGIAGMMLLGGFVSNGVRAAVTALLFGAAFIHYSWFTPFGAAHSRLFLYDQVSLTFLICFLSFIFFSESLVRGRALRPEGSAMKLCVGFLGTALLLANNLAIIVIALPMFLFFSSIGPSVSEHGQRARSGLNAVTWSVLLLCLLCVGAGLFMSGNGVMSLDSLMVSSVSRTSEFDQGWAVIFSALTVLVFFYPCAFLLRDSSESEDWGMSAVFRTAPSIVFCGLLFKWCRVEPNLPPLIVIQILVGSLSFVLFWILIFGRGLLLVVQALAMVPMTLLFWSLTETKSIPAAMSALFIFSVAVSRLIYLFNFLGVKPGTSVRELHAALRAASFGLRLEVFVLGLSLMPLGTFLGFNFHIQLPIEASICAASLTFAIALFLGRILEMKGPVEGAEVRLNQAESAIGVITLAALIVLGIYPTPLYNYINYLSHHP
jgi:hypothetical protein